MKFPTIDPRPLFKPAVNLARAWEQFWFTPADPTVLGVVRICTGLMLLYILITSTPFLPWLYGKDAWVDLRTTDVMRKETPWVPPSGNWVEPFSPDSEPGKMVMPEVVRPELSTGPAADAYRLRWGVDPGWTIDMGQSLFSQWFHVTDPFWMRMVHGIAILVAVLFTLGVGTRVVSVLAWALALGYIHRTQASLFGMDTMLAILLLYLMAGPAGAALSVDRLVERFRVSWGCLAGRKPLPALAPLKSVSANVVLRLLQVHFCVIYLASGTSKLQGAAWWNGTALWQTFSNYEFAPARFELYTTLLRWSTQNRLVFELINTGGDVFTLCLEMGLPFLIWFPRWRWVCLAGAVMLHTGIALTMGLTTFSLLMIVILLSFVPAATVHALLARLLGGRPAGWLLYSSRPKVGVRLASLVHAFDAYDQVALADAAAAQRGEDEPAWLSVPGQLPGPQLVTESGQTLTGYALAVRVVRSLRVLWPVALLTWLPGASRLGRALSPSEESAAEVVGSR